MDDPQNLENLIRGMTDDQEAKQTKMLQDEIQAFQLGYTAPPPPEPPQTFVIECNKSLSQQDGDSDNTNAWTNHFPPIKLKKGDVVSVNSAFLSSRGSGDLIQFDETNNTTRIIFEYYATNDNVNNKRPTYNIQGGAIDSNNDGGSLNIDGSTGKSKGKIPCFPANYRPIRLQRLVQTFIENSQIAHMTLKANFPQYFSPQSVAPFKYPVKRPYWGYQTTDEFLDDSIEDKYVPGLYRNALVDIKETIITANDDVSDGYNAGLGYSFQGIRVWYVSTNNSKYGPCSGSGGMRIYFPWGYSDQANVNNTLNATLPFLKKLRVGDFVQFSNVNDWAGFNTRLHNTITGSIGLTHKNSTTGAYELLNLPNAFYCSGYASINEGFGASGTDRDIFSVMGGFPVNPPHTTAPTDMTTRAAGYHNPLGGVLKITRISIGATDTANKNGNWNLYPSKLATPWTLTTAEWDTLPFIEVIGDGAISVAYGNPSVENTAAGSPWFGAINTAGATGLSEYEFSRFTSPNLSITIRTYKNKAHSTIQNYPALTESSNRKQWECGKYQDYYPEPVSSGGDDDQDLLVFRPSYYSPQVNTDQARNNTGYCKTMDEGFFKSWSQSSAYTHNESEFLLRFGYEGSKIDSWVASNHNFKLLGSDGSASSNPNGEDGELASKWGNNIVPDPTENYAGMRLPSSWLLENDQSKYNTDNTKYCVVKRRATYDTARGYERWIRAYNPTSTGAGDFYNSFIQSDGFFNPAKKRLTASQRRKNANGDIFIQNEHGANIQFYLGITISNAGNVYSGSAPVVPNVNPASADYIGNGTDFSTGSANYISGAWNVPNANSNPYDGEPPQQGANDMWYGYYALDDGTQPAAPFNIAQPISRSSMRNTDSLFDYRFLLNTLPRYCYARFTNEAKETEVMFIQIIVEAVAVNPILAGHIGGDWSNNAQWDASALIGTPGTIQLNPPVIYNTAGGHASDDRTNSRAVRLHILKRDILGTGLKSFSGIYTHGITPLTTHTDAAGVGHCNFLNPRRFQTLGGATNGAGDKLNTGVYFEIYNPYANTDYEYELVDMDTNILSMGTEDFTGSIKYQNHFGLGGSEAQRDLGGDFYLVDKAMTNMPFIDDNDIVRMTDSSLRLNPKQFSKGEPTATSGVNPTYNTMTNTGRYVWDTHYDYIDLKIDLDNPFYSPTDIQNLITKQLHAPQDLYKSYSTNNDTSGGHLATGGGGRLTGGFWPNTSNKFPTNSLFRVIHGPNQINTNTGNTITDNKWDLGSGYLQGLYHEGDFCFELDHDNTNMRRSIMAEAFAGRRLIGGGLDAIETDLSALPNTGNYKVWIQNDYSYVNTMPTADNYILEGGWWNNFGSKNPTLYWEQIVSPTWSPFTDRRHYTYDETFVGQFIGTNNAELNYNTDISRFEWKFLHQPLYSDYTTDPNTGVASGGQIIAKIWGTSVQGTDNWDRYGGVNIVNWVCDSSKSFNSFYSRFDPSYTDPLATKNSVSTAFMNKLGFTNNWLDDNSGSTTYSDIEVGNTQYKPKGTTASDYNVAQSRPYTQRSNMKMRDWVSDGNKVLPLNTAVKKAFYGNQDNSDVSIAGVLKTNYQGLTFDPSNPKGFTDRPNIDGHSYPLVNTGSSVGYEYINTSGTPPTFQSVDAAKGTDGTGSGQTGIRVLTSMNFDDVKHMNMAIEVDSSSLVADELPKKTDIGYFLILSDLIDKHEFYGSANDGSPLKCLGILSKNYENNDFFFSFQSPVEFYIKQDRTITSIRTEIKTPSLKDPIGLDYNSSIIYTINRPETIPEPDVPPMSLIQAFDYDLMEQMTKQLGINTNAFGGSANPNQMGIGMPTGGGGSALNSLRSNLVSTILNPNNQTASNILATQTAIASNLSRMSVGERMRVMRSTGTSIDPSNVPPIIDPTEARTEGLGIAEPGVVMTAGTYVSPEQLKIEEANREKEKGEDPFAERPPSPAPKYTDPDDFGFPDLPPAYRSVERGRSARQMTPREEEAELTHLSRSGAIKSMGLKEIYGGYISHGLTEQQRQGYYQLERKGWDVENPDTWSKALLTNWLGRKGTGEWSSNLHKAIGGKLSPEAVSKLQSSLERITGKTPQEQIQLRREAEAKSKPKERTGMAEKISSQRVYGETSLYAMIMRTDPDMPHHDKDLPRHDWDTQDGGKAKPKKVENPYDMRSWRIGRIESYMKKAWFGYNKDHPNHGKIEYALNEEGYSKLESEWNKRKFDESGRKRKTALQPEVKLGANRKYSKPSQIPHKNYTTETRHLYPHSSVGTHQEAVEHHE